MAGSAHKTNRAAMRSDYGTDFTPSYPEPFSSAQGQSKVAATATSIREVMDIRNAAEYLGISPDSLYKYASENFIPAFKLGNRWRFKRSLLERWMEHQSSTHAASLHSKSAKPKQKKPSARAR